MRLFFDTSALVKYFHNEIGSKKVIELIENPENEIWVSDLAKVEFVSALHRKFRCNDISMEQLNSALKGFDSEWKYFNIQPLDNTVISTADLLLRKNAEEYRLRALDALHFASFSLLAENNWAFVVADKLLADTVTANKFKVIRIALAE